MIKTTGYRLQQLAATPLLAVVLIFISCFSHAQEDRDVLFVQARLTLSTSPQQARDLLDPELQHLQQMNVAQQLELLDIAIQASLKLGDIERAQSDLESLSSLAIDVQNLDYRGRALQSQGRLAAMQTRHEDALNFYEQAIPLFQRSHKNVYTALTYNYMGQSLRALGRYAEGMSKVRKALALLREIGQTAPMAEVFNSIGVLFERQGNYEEALAAHTQALEIRKVSNDNVGMSDSLYNIGEIYRELKDFNSAEIYLTQSLSIDSTLSNRNNAAFGHFKLADIQCALDKFELARGNGLKALQIFTDLNATNNMAESLAGLAKVEIRSGHLDAATQYLARARALLNDDSHVALVQKLQYFQAKILVAQEKWSAAEVLIAESLAVADETQSAENVLGLHLLLSDVLAKQNNLQGAVDVLREHNRIKDKVISEVRAQSVANVQSSVDFLHREQQLELLSRDKKLRLLKDAQQKFESRALIVAIALAIIILYLVYIYVGTRRYNKAIALQLQSREQELRNRSVDLDRANSQLLIASQNDALTGLHNRRFLVQHIEQDCAKSIRDYLNWLQQKNVLPVQSDLIFYLVDLDNFKRINDEFGHAAGDAVLAQMKAVLAKVFRETDYMVRWDGEEFLVVARFSQRENAALLAERLRKLIAKNEFDVSLEKPVRLTASIGFASFPFYTDRPAQYAWGQVVDIAELCVYAAKHSGRNCWIGLTGVEGLEKVDTFQRLFTEPAQVVGEGWVNLYSTLEKPENVVWHAKG